MKKGQIVFLTAAGVVLGAMIYNATKIQRRPAIAGQYSEWLDTYLDWNHIRQTGNAQRIE